MKNLVAFVCLFASAGAFAVSHSYVARLNDEGKYCAKIDVGIVTPYHKTKCYTIEQWKENGYTVEEVQ